jgi:hypothetical protein
LKNVLHVKAIRVIISVPQQLASYFHINSYYTAREGSCKASISGARYFELGRDTEYLNTTDVHLIHRFQADPI